MRVTLFWYIVGALVLFIGHPDWAEARYITLAAFPWVPELKLEGWGSAAEVQWALILYWTIPIFSLWGTSVFLGVGLAELRFRFSVQERELRLKPQGEFWGVHVPSFSLGVLPRATTPPLEGRKVAFAAPGAPKSRQTATVLVEGPVKEALKMLSPAERQLCEELLQVLVARPDHFAGLGHGVGLLEHTLNVVAEASTKCTPEFRLPFVAALAHDIGKLITFKPDGEGGWTRRGLHSRESARILATLPGFQELPEVHQRGLLLAVKYDHAPSKMPDLRGDREASMLAMRVISALSSADKSATAAEKERNLEKLQPEDLLWKDFVDFLREAPVVQRGKKGAANQVNNPPDSPFLFVYEAQWRDDAVQRLPAEVAAALDLTRRDSGKLAKYTRILAERLRKEGLLLEEYSTIKDGEPQLLKTAEGNPLWDIQSGTGEKAVVMRGILVLRAEELWKKVNYRLGIKSPFPVTILAPNAGSDGRVNQAPFADRGVPDVSDGLKVADVQSAESMASLGLGAAVPGAEGSAPPGEPVKPKSRSRGAFRQEAPDTKQDNAFGLTPPGPKPAPREQRGATPVAPVEQPVPREVTPPTPAVADVSPDLSTTIAAALDYMQGDTAPVDPGEPGSLEYEDPTEPQDLPVPAQGIEPPVASVPAKAAAVPPLESQESANAVATQAAGPQIELSRAEKREGIAIADEAAISQYPGLKLGEKYYTAQSGAVQAGHRKPGARYKGDNNERKLELTETGPRRRVRRTT